MHWSEKIAKDIIKRSPDKEEYVCAAGISPSGSIHIGNFRDIATSYFVYRARRLVCYFHGMSLTVSEKYLLMLKK